MRIIGLFAMCLWLGACTTTPLFPSEIMKDVETDTAAFKAWKDQSDRPSTSNFVSHKVELGAQILNVIRKPQGVTIIAEEQPIDPYIGYGPTKVIREGAFHFAIDLKSISDVAMFQAGNQLAVVGVVSNSRQEVIDGVPRVLPHLSAQCLHIWKTQEYETDVVPWEGSMGGYYPLEEQTFCKQENTQGVLATGDDQRKSLSDLHTTAR